MTFFAMTDRLSRAAMRRFARWLQRSALGRKLVLVSRIGMEYRVEVEGGCTYRRLKYGPTRDAIRKWGNSKGYTITLWGVIPGESRRVELGTVRGAAWTKVSKWQRRCEEVGSSAQEAGLRGVPAQA